jgi:hypothetical protein
MGCKGSASKRNASIDQASANSSQEDWLMKTVKEGRPRTSEAYYYRRKARDAEHAADTAETAEAKQFNLESAKAYHAMADDAEKAGR